MPLFALAPVSVVVPIQRLSVIFRLLFNWYLNRQYERIETNIVIGIILSVFGAAALGVDTTAALDWLDPNPVIYSILNWRALAVHVLSSLDLKNQPTSPCKAASAQDSQFGYTHAQPLSQFCEQ